MDLRVQFNGIQSYTSKLSFIRNIYLGKIGLKVEVLSSVLDNIIIHVLTVIVGGLFGTQYFKPHLYLDDIRVAVDAI